MVAIPPEPARPISSSRVWLARGLAVAADALQIAAFPFFFQGAISPFEDVVDIVMAIVLTVLLGWHIAFVPTFLIKSLPFADLAPTWTIAVLVAGRGRRPGTGVANLLGAMDLPGVAAHAMRPWAPWYASLRKPALTPSPRTIGIIWAILYPLIIVSFGYVFGLTLMHRLDWRVALPFGVNLLANLLFTPILFRLKNLPLATLDILIVDATLVWAVAVIWPSHPWVALAQMPYLLWVCIATLLQIGITRANAGQSGRSVIPVAVNRVASIEQPGPPTLQ